MKIPLSSEQSVSEQIYSHLKEKKSLIVLDNFEQVIDAAKFVSELLKKTQKIACLITSQHLLQISGEVEYALEPLEIPGEEATLAECERNPAIQLFVERAQAAKASFELNNDTLPSVLEICRRLEGHPLALELTAALVRGIQPQQILPRLKDRFKLLASSRRDLDPRATKPPGSDGLVL